MRLRRFVALLCAVAAGTAGAQTVRPAPARLQASLEAWVTALEVERRLLGDDQEALDRAGDRVVRAESAHAQAVAEFGRLVREPNLTHDGVDAAERTVGEAAVRLRAERERQERTLERVAEHLRKVLTLRAEIARRRGAGPGLSDPVSGPWQVTLDPGNRHGVFRLMLDGTIVGGRYVMDGGFRGSLRGTFVGEKLTLQRVDAERGFDATFYGKLSADRRSLAGSWEGTNLTPAAGPYSGTWSARSIPDEGEDDNP